jgi:outer membrane immunogenic protein
VKKEVLMSKLAKLAVPALMLLPQAAWAQSFPAIGPHVRVEANVGGDRFQAQGTHRNRFGYGATAGGDIMFPAHILFGAEASYWRTRHGSQICTTGTASSTLCTRSGREYGAAFRLGLQVTPALLVYGKGGYVNNRQSGTFVSPTGLYYLNGQIVGPGYSTSARRSIDGYQLGGGVEFGLMSNLYVSAQYVRSRYDDHTSRQRALLGVGFHL